MKTLAVCLCACVLAVALRAQAPVSGLANGMNSAKLAEAKQLLERYVSEQQIAGAVAAVSRHGRMVWSAAVGVQDVTTRVPMSEQSIFRIYSMTKAVTAVAVMMLHEQGKFQLDEPVSKYLPEFATVRVESGPGQTRAPARAITIQDLLLHTSGLNHRTSDEYRAAGVRARNFTLPRFVSNIVTVPLKEDPGTRFRYSEATTVLGRLVEIWSGQPFDIFLETRVLGPLKMSDTSFVVPPAKAGRLATVYAPTTGAGLTAVDIEAVPFTTRPVLLEGAVGLVSTVPDFWRFAQMLLNGGALDGARILKPDTVDRMVANALAPDVLAARGSGAMGWGLANVDVVMDPTRLRYPASRGEYGWDGTAGTIFWVDPAKQMVTILMTQSTPANPNNVRQRFKTLIEEALSATPAGI